MKSPWPAGERPKSACVCGGATGDVVKHSWKSWGLHITLQHLIKDVSQGTRRSRCLLHRVNIELVSLVVTHEFLLIHMEATSWSALSLRQIFVSRATLHLNGPTHTHTHTHTHTRAAVLQPGLCSTRIRSIQLPIIIDQSVVKWGGGGSARPVQGQHDYCSMASTCRQSAGQSNCISRRLRGGGGGGGFNPGCADSPKWDQTWLDRTNNKYFHELLINRHMGRGGGTFSVQDVSKQEGRNDNSFIGQSEYMNMHVSVKGKHR